MLLTDNKSLSGEMDGNGYTHPVKKRTVGVAVNCVHGK
jgi:hypothetical protein